MQNYGQTPVYQRPGSTTGYAGQQPPPPPPSYGGYQSAAPQQQSQWAAPAQSQQWNQPQQQATGGYNPNTYGAMPGAQGGQQTYPGQQQDQPPPPPPKPYGFVAAVQQQQQQQQHQQSQQPQQYNNQAWQQPQQGTAQTPQQQGGYPVQGGGQTPQQPYNNAAPPPPSATPGGSYFPPTQGGRPGSIYGANQIGSPTSTPAGQQPTSVISPNEQQPAYIPPSLTGQGVQAYMPSNTNPMPGVYVPPPPDIPAWQQAQHAPLQGGNKKFRYTKPSVDPSFYAQGYQGVQPMQQQPPLAPRPPEYQNQSSMPPPPAPQTMQAQLPHQGPTQAVQYPQQQQVHVNQQPQIPPPSQGFGHGSDKLVYNQYGASHVSKPSTYDRPPLDSVPLYGASNMSKPIDQHPQQQQQPQWPYPQQTQPNQPNQPNQGFVQGEQHAQVPYVVQQQPQQQPWNAGHQPAQPLHGSIEGQQYQGMNQGMEAPKPLSRTDTASSNFYNQASPQSQPVSPINNRQSMSFPPGQNIGVGRSGSVSSIALANLHAQREGNRTSSPKPAPPKLPTPPPPRDDKSKFSALGTGGPSDWEHFGAEAEIDDEEIFAKKKNEPVQLDSVELPASQPELNAGPSPPSTHGWPSPATQPAPLHANARQDTYQPTPPPTVVQLAQPVRTESPQQSFIMGDAAPAPLRLSPKPGAGSRPSSTQQRHGAWQAPGNGTPIQQGTPVQQQPQHQPPPASQGFVMDDGGWAAQSTASQGPHAGSTQQQQPVVTTGGFKVGDGEWGASQQTPTQERSAWASQPSQDHSAELKAKDEALERLKTESETEKASLRAEIERLRTEIAAAQGQVVSEKAALQQQVEDLRSAAEEAKASAEVRTRELKEKEVTLERLKEDLEGKEHNIEEREITIGGLRQQLELEKTKEHPKPTPVPADLIPDLDPWYAGSLERYIAMLRSEASVPDIQDKIKTFKAFLQAESAIRGIEPPEPVQQVVQVPPMASHVSKPTPTHDELDAAIGTMQQTTNTKSVGDLKVHVPPQSPTDDDYDFSPGGRPRLRSKVDVPSHEDLVSQRNANTPASSTAIPTPASSVDEDSNRTPVQSPPESQAQTEYKAYVPSAAVPAEPAPLVHRQSMSISNVPPVGITSNTSKGHDEIFFGAHDPEPSKPASHDATTDAPPDVSVPAPLTFASNRPKSVALPAQKDAAETLASLLPNHIAPATESHFITDVRSKLTQLKQSSTDIDTLTKAWEKSAALTRRKNDDARRKRQEEQEENNDDAFNNNEISYADLNVLEEEFKHKEANLKAQEDREEYKSYVEAVFDPVYDSLQSDIKVLMDLHVETESLLHMAVSGVQSLENGDAPSTYQCLELLKELHERVLERQDKVVQAVAERDRRYKKTEIQPLYAAGNIAKMKTVEKHFENAEKQALVRAKRDTAARVGDLVSVAEDVVVNAVGIEQREIDAIISALHDLDETQSDTQLVDRAHDTVARLKASSKALLSLLNTIELDLNNAVSDAELAQAKAENADAAQTQQLEAKKAAEEKKLKDEFERKVKVLEHDQEEIQALVQEKGGKVEVSEEAEKEKRLKAALEAAKKRNGHA